MIRWSASAFWVCTIACATDPVPPLKSLPAPAPSPDLRERLLETSDGCLPLLVEEMWHAMKPELQAMAADPPDLYTLQARTATFLMAIDRCRRIDLLDDFAGLLLRTFAGLRLFSYVGIDAEERQLSTWRAPGEGELANLLSTAQFMYPVAVTLRIRAQTAEPSRPNLQALAELAPLVLEHYRAWIAYHRRFSAPGAFYLTHAELIRTKRRLPAPEINVTDLDLWILAGLVELLAAREADPSFEIDSRELDLFREHVMHSVALLESNLVRTSLRSFSGRRVEGVILDPGFLRDGEEHRFAGYQGEQFPNRGQVAPVAGVGWDISHSSRLVQVIETLHRHRRITGMRFPERADVERFANQLAYRVFRGDFDRPLFNNYWDGSNGWYRVEYLERKGFGYAPSDLSIVALSPGFGFWAEVNPDIERINCALLQMIAATPQSNAELAAHRDAHYGRFWSDHERRTLLRLDRRRSWELLAFPALFSGRMAVVSECLNRRK